TRMRGGGDHGSVVSGEGATWEEDVDRATRGFGNEARAQFAIGGDAAGDENRTRVELFGGVESARGEIINDGALETGDEIERRLARKPAKGVGGSFTTSE